MYNKIENPCNRLPTKDSDARCYIKSFDAFGFGIQKYRIIYNENMKYLHKVLFILESNSSLIYITYNFKKNII